MRSLVNSFTVSFTYAVHFTKGLFREDNTLFREVLGVENASCGRKVLFVIDHGLQKHHPFLSKEIRAYFKNFPGVELCDEILLVHGGEQVKNDSSNVDRILSTIEENGICRHSFVVAIGGGAVLDMVGYAAAIAHRGIRHIRIPTTVLSQNDSGIGVKNGVNAFGKKNFIGAFAPPYAVINDSDFLLTLEDRDWRSGIAEAIKVALIKDPAFFYFIEVNTEDLIRREITVMEKLIHRCAELHMNHIAGNDPFEKGSSRPLDFGHWSAHKLEQMTMHRIRHGEAVAIGMALDATISMLSGLLTEDKWQRILSLVRQLGFEIYLPELSAGESDPESESLIKGLAEFREHLGGKLTIMLLDDIGKGIEVNHIDEKVVMDAVSILKRYSKDIKVA